MSAKLLIIDDDRTLASTLGEQLATLRTQPSAVHDLRTARQRLRDDDVDLILLDLSLPDGTGLELIRELRARNVATPVIMISGQASVAQAVTAMQEGAFDFLVKPIEFDVLEAVVRRALATVALRDENARLRQLATGDAGEFVGDSPVISGLLAQATRLAAGDDPVLIEGETGTGKQVLARWIHARSPRSGEPFVTVNCAAITESLFESELFGHEKGAFTGALLRKPGKLELVGNGTLFLDEIGELPVQCQAKLLTALEDRVFERVGGVRPLAFAGRVIAATNRELDKAIAASTFRRDLYFRLNTFHLKLPPLRTRPGDIPLYVAVALARARRRLAREFKTPDDCTLDALKVYPWPGNVRELMHHVDRIALLSDSLQISPSLWLAFPPLGGDAVLAETDDLREATERFRRAHIERVLASCGLNQTEAAKRLGIERTHLNRVISEFEGRRQP
jgi:DNA-binding NtrC family response regulator